MLAPLLAAGLSLQGQAGSGRVNSDGTIDFTINLRFTPFGGEVATIQTECIRCSQLLWDASEGQLRLGNVTITAGSVNEDLADVWVFPQNGRAGVTFWTDGSGLGRRGIAIGMFMPFDGAVLAHELGHLALGLADEYDEQSRFGGCSGIGQCIENADLSEANQCLMQQAGGFSWSEFCTTGRHDTVMGDGLPCPVPSGCPDGCQLFNRTTGRYETTQQSIMNGGRSCWAHLPMNFGFLTPPTGLPVVGPPPGFVNPVVVDRTPPATDTVMLILDRSGSMAWNTESDNGEVCGDGLDNDGDGMIDEGDCTQTRLQFLKAAARVWLEFARNRGGIRAGIVSFNDVATLDRPFQAVDNVNLPNFITSVNALAAGGNTAIGLALSQTIFTFDAETTARNKTAFLISDGENTAGPAPATVVPALTSRGIRVFTISTGGASNDETLDTVSGGTSGSRVDSKSATTLVNAFAKQWANFQNIGMLIPQRPYQSFEDQITFEVEKGTVEISLVLAGDLADMKGFGVHAFLTDPNTFVYDSEAPVPNMVVRRDTFFTLVQIQGPEPGTWRLVLRPAPGASSVQTGNLTLLADNPEVDFFTSLDRRVVGDPTVPVRLFAAPIFRTPLFNSSISATVRRPDGTSFGVPLTENGDVGTYEGSVGPLFQPGSYEVTFALQTDPLTFNHPGESILAPLPPDSVPVPTFTRQTVESFIVLPPPCPDPAIERQGANLRLWWLQQDCTGGCTTVLDSATRLNPPDWTPVGASPQCLAGTCEVILPAPDQAIFYRLRCIRTDCITFKDSREALNPWYVDGYRFEQRRGDGTPVSFSLIRTDFVSGQTLGLHTVNEGIVTLPHPAVAVSLDLVSASIRWQVTAYSEDGEVVVEKSGSGDGSIQTVDLAVSTPIIRTVVVRDSQALTIVARICASRLDATSRVIVGCVKKQLPAGYSMVANPFFHLKGNSINEVLPLTDADLGTTVYKFSSEGYQMSTQERESEK